MNAAVAISIDQRLAGSYRADIENLVAQAALTEAFAKLQDFVRDLAPHLKSDTLVLCSRFSKFASDYRVGRVKWDDSAPLVGSLLDMVEEVHRCALVKPQYRLSDRGPQPQTQPQPQPQTTATLISESLKEPPRAPVETASNVTPLRPGTQPPPASESEGLDNLRRAYWKRFRETRPPSQWVAFSCKNLSRGYQKGGFRLSNLSFELSAGEITGVVGRNASGKTTLLRLVTGDLAPHEGTAEYPMLTRTGSGWPHIKRQIAYVSQSPAKWYGRLRPNLNFIAAAYGVRGKANTEMVDWHVQRFGLSQYENFTWDEITGGYRTRFELVKALLTRPKLLVLDEPLAQLDVMARQEFLSNLETIATSFEEPVPVIITSQHLYEIEAVATQMIVLDDGACIYSGPCDRISEKSASKVIEITLKASDGAVAAALAGIEAESIVRTMEGFIITLPRDTRADMAFAALYRVFGNELIAFRDITNSARRLFQSEGETRAERPTGGGLS